MKIAFIIPSYNTKPWSDEFSQKINNTARSLKEIFDVDVHLVYIDDGSTISGTKLESHRVNFDTLAFCEVTVAKHLINRGQGATLMTALSVAREIVDADFFATFDADEQHDPQDVLPLFRKLITEDLNIVFGNRFMSHKNGVTKTPKLRYLILKLATFFERYITGLRLQDAHNGFRVFDRLTADILKLKQDRMAHATEIKILVARHKLKYGEESTHITYTGRRLREGQSNLNAVNILQELIKEKVF